MYILLNTPFVQQSISQRISAYATKALGSRFSIQHVEIGLFNRIILEDIALEDLHGENLLNVARVSVKIELLPLFQKKISISNAQFFGFNIHLSKADQMSKPNFQFIIDAFSSDNEKKNPLNLRINSLLIRRGRIQYDVWSEAETPHIFNPNHLSFQNIAGNISLKALQNDSINATIKRFGFEEVNSGFKLLQFSTKIEGSNSHLNIENFRIDLPKSQVCFNAITSTFEEGDSLSQILPTIRASIDGQSSVITPSDLAAFAPILKDLSVPFNVNLGAEGTPQDFRIKEFRIDDTANNILITAHATARQVLNPDSLSFSAFFDKFQITQSGFSTLFQGLRLAGGRVPSNVSNLGTVLFHGNLEAKTLGNISAKGVLQTDKGLIESDFHLKRLTSKALHYEGNILTEGFNLKGVLGENFGSISMNINAEGSYVKGSAGTTKLLGEISTIEYNNYAYKNIYLDGEYSQAEGYRGNIRLDDPNLTLAFNGKANINKEKSSFNFIAQLKDFKPNKLNLSSKYVDTGFSTYLRADFEGGTLNDLNGIISIDSLCVSSPEEQTFIRNITINTNSLNRQAHKSLNIKSDFLNGSIQGHYNYTTLPKSIVHVASYYLPSLLPPQKNDTDYQDNFEFNLILSDSRPLSALLEIPLTTYAQTSIKGFINEPLHKTHIEGFFPRLQYNNRFYESGVAFINSSDDYLNAHFQITTYKAEGPALNVVLESKAENDKLFTSLYWGNNHEATISGNLKTRTIFANTGDKGLQATIDIEPTNVIINDTIWDIQNSRIVYDKERISIEQFEFSSSGRRLYANGIISKSLQDSIRLDLKDINIGYVFEVADLGVDFKGEASGPATAYALLSEEPVMRTDLFIKNFGLNKELIGDMNIRGEWHNDVKGIYLDANIHEKDLAVTHVDGYIYPLKPAGLDLHIEAGNLNLKFIQYYLKNISSDFSGRISGNIHFYGAFNALNLQGKADCTASIKVDPLNTTYFLQDSILVEPGGLTFQQNTLSDSQGHQGSVDGYVHYNHFRNISYLFSAKLNNMLVMNLDESPDFPIYGTMYGTGNATISGNLNDGMRVNAAITTNRNSTFTYIKDYVMAAADNQFVRFVDKTPRRIIESEEMLSDFEIAQQKVKEEEESVSDIRLNLLIDVTPDATMKIIMDPVSGDYISGRGEGSIRTDFYNKGDIRMFGTYRIEQGVYKFSLQEIIRKDFNIRDGSNIAFNGIPGDATLDIKTVYTVNSASLNDLMPNASDYVNQTNVKVNCTMDIIGKLTAPEIKLGLELPNERDEIQALVRNYIPTDEQMNLEILYLLSIGKFYTPENVATSQNSDMMSSVLSSTLSGQLSNALSQIIDNNNWNFGTNFSTGEKGWTDVEFEGILSGRLLNNRLIVNGNFGYRDNPMANTNFVGDFEAEWLVNKSGDIRLKAYNKTNDKYYTKTNLTTQGIGVIFRKDFNEWKELLFWNKWKLKQLKKHEKDTPNNKP